MFSWKGISFLTSVIGSLKKLHPETETCKFFDEAKVFVQGDLTKELPSEFRFQSRSCLDVKVKYEYPWLPPRSITYSRWGHFAKVCNNKERESLGEPTRQISPPVDQSTIDFSKETTILAQKQLVLSGEKEKVTRQNPTVINGGGEICSSSSQLDPSPNQTSSLPNSAQQPTSIEDLINLTASGVPELEWKLISPPSKKQGTPSPTRKNTISISPSQFAVLEEADDQILDSVQEADSIKESDPSHPLLDCPIQELLESSQLMVQAHPNPPSLRSSRLSTKSISNSEIQNASMSSVAGVLNKRKTRRKN